MAANHPPDLLGILNNEFRACILANSFRTPATIALRDVMEGMEDLITGSGNAVPDRSTFRHHLDTFSPRVLEVEQRENGRAGNTNYYRLQGEGRYWVDVAILLLRTSLDLDLNVERALGLVQGDVNTPYYRATILDQIYHGNGTTLELRSALRDKVDIKYSTLIEQLTALEREGLINILGDIEFSVKDPARLEEIDVSHSPRLKEIVAYLIKNKGDNLRFNDIYNSTCADRKGQRTYTRELLMRLYKEGILDRNIDLTEDASNRLHLTKKGKGFYEGYLEKVLNISKKGIRAIRQENKRYLAEHDFNGLISRSLAKYFGHSSYATALSRERLGQEILRLTEQRGGAMRMTDIRDELGPYRKYGPAIEKLESEGLIDVERVPGSTHLVLHNQL